MQAAQILFVKIKENGIGNVGEEAILRGVGNRVGHYQNTMYKNLKDIKFKKRNNKISIYTIGKMKGIKINKADNNQK